MEEKTAQTTEQAILEAAEREFLLKGFAGARTVSIARTAGVTHAMLHYYFHTKEQLFDRIIESKIQIIGTMFLQAFGQPGLPLLERICDGITRHFDIIAANPDLPRFIVNEVFFHPDRFDKMRSGIDKIIEMLANDLQQELDAAAAKGQIEPVDARMLMIDILSLNVFPFLAFPVLEPLLGDLTSDREQFFERRKAENVKIIMRRIQKS